MALYDDVVAMPPGLSALEGESDIRADFQRVFGNFTAEQETIIVGLEKRRSGC